MDLVVGGRKIFLCTYHLFLSTTTKLEAPGILSTYGKLNNGLPKRSMYISLEHMGITSYSKGLCRCDQVNDIETGRLSCIIQTGPYVITRDPEGVRVRKKAMWLWNQREKRWWGALGWEMRTALRNWKRKGMDSPLEILEEPHCQHLDFIRLIYKTFQTYDHQNYKI